MSEFPARKYPSVPTAIKSSESLSEFSTVLNWLPSPIWSIDWEGNLDFVNNVWIEFTGQTLQQARHAGWMATIHPQDLELIKAAWDSAFAARAPFNVEYRMRRADASYAWVHDVGTPRFATDGNFLGYARTFFNVTERRQAELAARERAEQLRLMADNIPALIAFYTSSDLRCQFANKAYARTYGWDERSIIGKTVSDVIGQQAYEAIAPHLEKIRQGQSVSYERQLTLPDGNQRIIEVNLLPHHDTNGDLTAAFVLINDITKHRLAEQSIRESEERLGKFADATREGILFHNNGIITDCNQAAAEFIKQKPADLIGRNAFDFVAPESREEVLANIRNNFEHPYEATLLRTDGTRFTAELVGKEIVYKGNLHRMTVVRDISDRKEAEARIQFLAHHDTLTHLPNRALLMDRLNQTLAAARRHGNQIGILFLDLDNFKTINDSLGHYAGDALLKRVASRLQGILRGVDLVGRFGGDEFLVVITDLHHANDIIPVVEKIAEAISEPFSLESQILNVSSSIGISIFPRDGENADTLIKNADAAMYLAKERGRNNYQFFTTSLQQSAFAALSMESGIRKAIKGVQFVLHYQPEIDVASGALIGVEALIRWRHPELGLLHPDQFIPIAEHRGLIMPIGKWVLEQACHQAHEWRNAGMPKIPIAINLSAIQFRQSSLAEDISRILTEHNLGGEDIELELTESMLMEDVVATSKLLHGFKDLGIKLAMDDFGTGYSSLSYLKRFPIDKLKIDRSFIRDIPADPDDVAITIAIINLAKSLGIKVLAEGVEHEYQVEFLKAQQCDQMQGYHIAYPMPAEEFLLWQRARPN